MARLRAICRDTVLIAYPIAKLAATASMLNQSLHRPLRTAFSREKAIQ
jgi:hypothetical protein